MLAIHYTRVKTDAENRAVFGLEVAILNWLKAFFRYGKQDRFHFLIGETGEWDEVREIASGAGLDPARLIALDRRFVRSNLANISTVFRLNPDSQKLLWQRQMLTGGFAFCGLAHAIAGIEAGHALEQYILAPSESTDAIVCPSRAVQSAIRAFWELYGDYLKQRFGATCQCPVQLPVIPLGIDVAHYEALASPQKRAEQRRKLGLADDDIMLLWVGRLSHAIKAHPLAMFQAAERAAETTGANVHLVMLGYFMPETAREQFRKLAQDFCAQAKVTFIANDDPRFPDGLWAAGDIFLSLIDNMQESFGLTPIEAMAAGLPRVISDWDGYRDSVQHGEDGFLVPTTQPPPGNGRALSELLLSGREVYGGFLARGALSVAVDQDKAAQAIGLLIQDKDKRKSVAEKARARVRATYDWKHIIPAYEALWQELAARRKKAQPPLAGGPDLQGKSGEGWPSPLPQAPDPFTMYAAYPSSVLNEANKVSVAADAATIKKLWGHEINIFGLDVMIPAADATKLINHVAAQGAVSIAAIFEEFPSFDRAQIWRTIAWLVKLGIFRLPP